MTPSWDDAPEWANWLAQDENYLWYWYEYKPVSGIYMFLYGGNCAEASTNQDWRDTLQPRPLTPNKPLAPYEPDL
jgi:hypothetical protein